MRSKAFCWRVLELLNVRRVDFPSRHPSHVESACLDVRLAWFVSFCNVDQERCPNRACSVSIVILSCMECTDGAEARNVSQYCCPVEFPSAHGMPCFVRVALFPRNVVDMSFSPILRIDMKWPPISGECRTFCRIMCLFSPWTHVVADTVPIPM
jgi:hypothetical protein